MAYVKTTWVEEITPTSAANFNHMEQGIYDAVRGQAEDALRIVRGQIGATGAIALGTGFTVAKNAVGSWTVTYAADFSAPPVVLVACQTPVNNGWVTLDNGKANNAHQFSVQGWTSTNNGVLTDMNWHFVAVGPA